MKICIVFAAYLALLTSSLCAQSVCRQVTGNVVERRDTYTILAVSLPSPSGFVAARAVIPNSDQPAGAFVFTLSSLTGSEPSRTVKIMPVAIELAKKGRSTIVIQRRLTWPSVDSTVGQMQATALCAEQWLSAHASVRSDDWTFVGPKADVPTFPQLNAVEDQRSMSFHWNFPLGGFNENRNTDRVLQDGSIKAAALTDFHD